MEKSDISLLQKAQKCHDQGKSLLQDHNKGVDWNDSIHHNFKQSLTLRESILGRYNCITVQSYAGLGRVYNQFGDPRAIVAYRTAYRIESILYGKCNGPITSTFKDVLLKRGLNQSSIDEIQRDILRSIQFEIEGDLLRRYASRKAAIIEYQNAAKIEESAFGRDNPDLAFLWRKMAVLCSVRKGMIRSIDFGLADRMNHQKWIKGFETSLFEAVCGAIQRGDKFYEDLLFNHAVGEYANAIHIGKHCSEDESETNSFTEPKSKSNNSQIPKRSQRSKVYDSNIESRPRFNNSQIPKRSQRNKVYDPGIVHDLRQLLYGESSKKEDGAQSTYPSTIQVQEWKDHLMYKPTEPMSPIKNENLTEECISGTDRVHTSKLKENSQPDSESTPIMSSFPRQKEDGVQSAYPSTIQVQEWKEHLAHAPAEPSLPVKKENLKEEYVSKTERVPTSKFEENGHRLESESTPIISSSSRPNEKGEISPPHPTGRKPKKQKGASSHSRSSKSAHSRSYSKSAHSRSSKSTHSRSRGEASTSITKPSSESSLVVGSNMESASDPGNPHSSMPSLPMVHDGLQPIGTHLSKQIESVRPRTPRIARQSHPRDVNMASILLRSPIAIKPGSESALFNRAAQNAAKHNKRITRHQSMSSLLGSPPKTPDTPLAEDAKGNITATFLSNTMEENSLLVASISPPEQGTEPSRQSSRNNELASILPTSERTTSLAIRSISMPSLGSRDSDPDGVVPRQSLFERFISQTTKVQAALDNESRATSTSSVGPISEPPLLDMLAHVQEINGLLQRQTFRLKNKLGITGMSEHGEILMTSNSKLADLKNNMDVVSEIEMLFESCAKILKVAMITAAEQAVDNEAMDEYRKTFAMENIFLNQLRKSFAEVGATLKGGSMVDYVGGASVAKADVSARITRLRRPSGGGANPPNMSKEEDGVSEEGASFANDLDDSGMCVVFEDRSNCSIEI